jgi:hypothetical protein
MKRIHFIEIGDQPWCPAEIRRGVTDYCRFVTQVSGAFNPIAPVLIAALQSTGAQGIVDMGSGAAGPWLSLQPVLRKLGSDIRVCLTDHDPNLEAFEWARRQPGATLTYRSEPVDATDVPEELRGFRTMFSAFHHLRPDQAHAALADATAKQQGIGIFDWTRPNLFFFPLLLLTPIRVFLATPFIRPFRWARLFWTYIVPALPVVLLFDTIVSLLRTYSEPELRELTADLDGCSWDIGAVGSDWMPVRPMYLIGIPKARTRDVDLLRATP